MIFKVILLVLVITAINAQPIENPDDMNVLPALIQRERRASQEPWGPLYVQGEPCPPNHFFYSECKTCVCSRTGTSAVCSRKSCHRK